jgi:uncharacterized protein
MVFLDKEIPGLYNCNDWWIMIKLNVAEIKKRLVGKTDFHFQVNAKELNLSEEDLAVRGPIFVDGEISNAGDVLLLKAVLRTKVERECARCLKTFVASTETEIMEKFFPVDAVNIDDDAFSYEFDVVDITEAVREGLLVAEPLQVLCKEECRGLCPVCGINRNVDSCDCDTDTVDPRLAALKQLFKK